MVKEQREPKASEKKVPKTDNVRISAELAKKVREITDHWDMEQSELLDPMLEEPLREKWLLVLAEKNAIANELKKKNR